MENKKQFWVGVGLSYVACASLGAAIGGWGGFCIGTTAWVILFSALASIVLMCKGAGID